MSSAHGALSTEGVLFAVAALVVLAKVGGLVSERLRQPAVLGELVTGILLSTVLGASGVALVRDEHALHVLAEIGVLLLLFDVGLEADLRAFRRVGVSSLLVALVGVAVPFMLGWGTSGWLLAGQPTLVHVFVGASLTATSVGITARVLKDVGASQRPEAQTVLGAALVDDVLGLVVLAVITGSVTAAETGGGVSWVAVAAIVLKAAAFLGLAVVAGHVLSGPLVHLVGRSGQRGLIVVVGVGLCFALAFAARAIGLAGIVGAFAAGLLLDPYGADVRAEPDEETLRELLHPLNDLFVPLFFVLMGLQVDLAALANRDALFLGGMLVIAAVLGKLACGAGVVGRGVDRLAVAIGMIPRGEVGLIFAGIGAGLTLNGRPLVDHTLFSALVLMVLVTTLVTPPALRWRLAAVARRRG
jgi:Kef-type K+ transport system membrane component KefB